MNGYLEGQDEVTCKQINWQLGANGMLWNLEERGAFFLRIGKKNISDLVNYSSGGSSLFLISWIWVYRAAVSITPSEAAHSNMNCMRDSAFLQPQSFPGSQRLAWNPVGTWNGVSVDSGQSSVSAPSTQLCSCPVLRCDAEVMRRPGPSPWWATRLSAWPEPGAGVVQELPVVPWESLQFRCGWLPWNTFSLSVCLSSLLNSLYIEWVIAVVLVIIILVTVVFEVHHPHLLSQVSSYVVHLSPLLSSPELFSVWWPLLSESRGSLVKKQALGHPQNLWHRKLWARHVLGWFLRILNWAGVPVALWNDLRLSEPN